MNVQIRTLAGDEWTLCRDLRRRALAESPDAFRATQAEEDQESDQWLEDLIRNTVEHPRGGLWIADVGANPVGMLFGRLDPDDLHLSIGAMWVDPEERDQGIGRALVAAAIEWAIEAGATTATLWVTEGNGSALALYRSCGFADTDERQPLRDGSLLYVSKLTADLSHR